MKSQVKQDGKLFIITYDLKEIEQLKIKKSQYSKNLDWLTSKASLAASNEIDFVTGDYGVKCIDDIFDGSSQFSPEKNKVTDHKKIKQQSIKRRRKYSETDGELNIDRYLMGCDTYYEQKFKRTTQANTNKISVYISSSANGGTDAETIKEFVYDCINYVDRKQKSGYSVEVYHTKYNTNVLDDRSTPDILTRTKIKEGGQYIDFQRMAAACYPAMHRWIAFRSFALTGKKINSSLGYPVGGKTITEKISTHFKTESSLTIVHDFQDWESNNRKLKYND
jgi:hypothetical protein